MSSDQELAIRSYLTFLADPDSLIDVAKIAKLESDVKAANDPIAKVKLLSELDRAKAVDSSMLRADFVSNAKKWAAANNVTAEAFRALGVSAETLSAAGFGKARKKPAPAFRNRAPGVKSERIRSAVLGTSGVFTIRDITDDTHATTATVTKVVNELVQSGSVLEAGPLANHARGRSPMQYKVK
jgi:hypothetical protein